jgi:two-component system alkaline phosphatase synthesis response regulator PhoP
MVNTINRLQEILKATTDTTTAASLQELINSLSISSSTVLDSKTKLLTVDGTTFKLTRQEYKMLESLIQANGVLSRQELLEKAWEYAYVGPRTVDVHIRKLRKKIGEKSIVTHAGMGYQLASAILIK